MHTWSYVRRSHLHPTHTQHSTHPPTPVQGWVRTWSYVRARARRRTICSCPSTSRMSPLADCVFFGGEGGGQAGRVGWVQVRAPGFAVVRDGGREGGREPGAPAEALPQWLDGGLVHLRALTRNGGEQRHQLSPPPPTPNPTPNPTYTSCSMVVWLSPDRPAAPKNQGGTQRQQTSSPPAPAAPWWPG